MRNGKGCRGRQGYNASEFPLYESHSKKQAREGVVLGKEGTKTRQIGAGGLR